MPHLILEYSSNITEKDNFLGLFQQIHNLLAEKINANISACKSRAQVRDIYYIADGKPQNAFIHLTLKIMPGRDEQTINKLAASLMSLLQKHFAKSLQSHNLKISLEIAELQHYYKTS